MVKGYLSAIFTIAIMLCSINMSAQLCSNTNTAFKEGEVLTYDLYFKYGILNSRAGISTISTQAVTFDLKSAYKVTLIANSEGVASKVYNVSDTLSSIFTKDLRPLKYQKHAHEGGDYTKEVATYKYSPNEIKINTKRWKDGTDRFNVDHTSKTCIYDMVSIVPYARNLDYAKMKKGDAVKIEFLSGKRKVNMEIEHAGTEKIKANNGKKYNCIKLVLSISDDAFANKEESMKVYLTNDLNRMPVRIDTKLKHGSTRAMLKDYKGNRYPIKD
nr:DUF3108 domain-containing protein [Dysgonomonas massiliensis]